MRIEEVRGKLAIVMETAADVAKVHEVFRMYNYFADGTCSEPLPQSIIYELELSDEGYE